MNMEENYKEKYEEALNAAKRLQESWKSTGNRAWKEIAEAFPQLEENEDERIRKALVKHFQTSKSLGDDIWGKFRIDDIIAYLEKQKESLHVPESCKENADSFTDDEDEKIRRFIQDRLTDRLWNPTWKFSRDDVLAYLERKKELFKEGKGLYWYDGKELTFASPAIESNPYDFAMSQQEKQKEQNKVQRTGVSGFTDVVTAIRAVYNEESAHDLIEYLTTLVNREKQAEQKPAEWSEEDEKRFNDVLNVLKYAYEDLSNHKSFDTAMDVTKAFDWMKNRFKYLRPHPHLKPNDEEMEALHRAIGKSYLDYDVRPLESLWNKLQGLKFISTQPQWKPSDDNIKDLQTAEKKLREMKYMGLAERIEDIRNSLVENVHYYD